MKFPCTMRGASRELGVSIDTVSRAVARFKIRTRRSPLNGKARLLDAAAFAQLKAAVRSKSAAAG